MMIKNIIGAFGILKLISKYPDIFKITQSMFDTLNVVATDGRPRTQNIIIDFKTDLIEPVEINMWVCVGKDNNPIIRIQELKKENEILKTLLENKGV